MARPRTGSRALAIYLNDHLGGATGGVELTRRLAGSHRDPGAATQLRRLADDIAADRQALLEIMAEFGVPVRRYKAGQGLDAVRPIRDEIERRVLALLSSLGVATRPIAGSEPPGN
ncbi:hypothetical protein [Jiangella anatolica]|uniref:Uncharacterized protein n=1 Tax=Jiangella anatolica TaxID=2670374 RepID=A0A2W2C0Q1_9ACTN|nr:hypothetical protein [Jiangella anatolica]PZF86304.1 hypothetical protein C1I92_02105 [Jiangella anatolica]